MLFISSPYNIWRHVCHVSRCFHTLSWRPKSIMGMHMELNRNLCHGITKEDLSWHKEEISSYVLFDMASMKCCLYGYWISKNGLRECFDKFVKEHKRKENKVKFLCLVNEIIHSSNNLKLIIFKRVENWHER